MEGLGEALESLLKLGCAVIVVLIVVILALLAIIIF